MPKTGMLPAGIHASRILTELAKHTTNSPASRPSKATPQPGRCPDCRCCHTAGRRTLSPHRASKLANAVRHNAIPAPTKPGKETLAVFLPLIHNIERCNGGGTVEKRWRNAEKTPLTFHKKGGEEAEKRNTAGTDFAWMRWKKGGKTVGTPGRPSGDEAEESREAGKKPDPRLNDVGKQKELTRSYVQTLLDTHLPAMVPAGISSTKIPSAGFALALQIGFASWLAVPSLGIHAKNGNAPGWHPCQPYSY